MSTSDFPNLLANTASKSLRQAYIEAPLAPIIYMRDLYKVVAGTRGFKPEKG